MAASSDSIRMAKAHVEVGGDLSNLQQALNAAKQQLTDWGKGVMAIGATMTGLGLAITGPMLYGLSVFKEVGGEIVSASRISGIGIEDLQTIAYATKTSFEELGVASKKMDKFISQAAAGSPEASRRLSELGLSIDQLSTLSEGDRIRTIGAAIAKTYSDVSQQHAAAMEIFGKSGVKLDLSGDFAGRERRLGELGGVMNPADVALAKEYGKALKELGLATQGFWSRIGAAIAPVMIDFVRLVTEGIVFLQAFVDGNRPLIAILFRVADVMVTVGAIIGGGMGLYYLAGFIGGFVPLMGMLSTALGIVAGGFGMVTAATWAWTALTALVSGAVAVYQFLAAGKVLATLATWGEFAAMAAYFPLVVLFYAAAGAAMVVTSLWAAAKGLLTVATTAETGATLGAKLAMWAYTLGTGPATIGTSILTAGLNLLVGALVLVGVAILALPFVWLGMAAYSAVSAAGIVGQAWDEATNSIGTALGNVWHAAKTMFASLADVAAKGFQGIKDAITTGDWGLAWDILKVSAQLAWLDIVDFALAAWEDLAPALISVFRSVRDAFLDMFFEAFAAIKIEIVRISPRLALQLGIEGTEAQIRQGAAQDRQARTRRRQEADYRDYENRMKDFYGEDLWEEIGDYVMEQFQIQQTQTPTGVTGAVQAIGATVGSDRASRQSERDSLLERAAIQRWDLEHLNWSDETPPTPNTELLQNELASVGSFSGAAISGYTGSSPAERTAAAAELAAERLAENNELLAQILRTPGALLVV